MLNTIGSARNRVFGMDQDRRHDQRIDITDRRDMEFGRGHDGGRWARQGDWRDRLGGLFDMFGGMFNRDEDPAQQSQMPAQSYSADRWNPYDNIMGSNSLPGGPMTIGSMLGRQPRM